MLFRLQFAVEITNRGDDQKTRGLSVDTIRWSLFKKKKKTYKTACDRNTNNKKKKREGHSRCEQTSSTGVDI